MSFVAVFSLSFCHGEEVASAVAEKLGLKLISERVIDDAAARHQVSAERLRHSMEGPSSILDSFRNDRARNLAYLREAMAECVVAGDAVYCGFGLHLLPRTLGHVLKVCLVANKPWRIAEAARAQSIPERKARKIVDGDDARCIEWTRHLYDLGPWDGRLYDEIIPMHTVSVDRAVRSILENARREVLAPSEASRAAAADFALAAKVEVAITREGYEAAVESVGGDVMLVLNKPVMRLEHTESELKRIASTVAGVKSASTRLGPKCHPGSYNDLGVSPPPRLLLVDDEKEFVHTLSERLDARDLGGAVAYDGEDALSFVESQVPEVMVLDLKMPGIDGIEVLRRVKESHPDVEVIILTGHGSEREELRAQELGAFAYLQKPVDIELLAKTVREAHRHHAQKLAAAASTEPVDGDDGERGAES